MKIKKSLEEIASTTSRRFLVTWVVFAALLGAMAAAGFIFYTNLDQRLANITESVKGIERKLLEPKASGGPAEDPKFKTTKEFDHMATSKIKLVNDDGQTVEFEMKIADEIEEQAAGFQNIGEGVIEKALMLFVFSDETNTPFHMQNVLAPLDIAFIKADGTIIDIMRMEPDPSKTVPLKLYGPKENQTFKYALEARAGFFKENNISAGKAKLVIESLSAP